MYDSDNLRAEFWKLASQFDDPAFVRRARNVADAWQQLRLDCQSARARLLAMSRMRLGVLGALVEHDWSSLTIHLCDAQDAERLAEWYQLWRPRLRSVVRRTKSPRKIRLALSEFVSSVQRFNVRWQSFLLDLDLQPINELRENYNKYYVLEKACALGSERIAKAGFEPLPPITIEEVSAMYPPIAPPALR